MLWALLGSVLLFFGLIALFIIDSRDSLWLVALHVLPGLGLLALAAVTSAADIRNRLGEQSSRRGLLFGGNAVAQTAIVAVILGMCAFLSLRHPKEWDWTEAGVHSLAKGSIDTLAQVPKDDLVEVYAFFLEPAAVRPLLESYRYAGNDRFEYQLINPNQQIEKAERFEIKNDGMLVVCRGHCEQSKRQCEQTPAGEQCRDVVEKAPMTNTVSERSEEKLTQAIRSVLSTKRKIYFLSGHAEGDPDDAGPQGMAQAREALEAENMEVVKYSLINTPGIPSDADAVVLAGPRQEYLEAETQAIDKYVRGGGSALVMVEPMTDTKLETVLDGWGLKLAKDVVVQEQQQLFGPSVLSLDPLATEFGEHPITSKLRGGYTAYRLARSVEPKDPQEKDIVKLVETGGSSWAAADVDGLMQRQEVRLDPSKDRKGPISIGVARTFKPEPKTEDKPADAKPEVAEGEKKPEAREGRVVVMGDADFARNQRLGVAFNKDLLMNTANWLVGEQQFITIERKRPRASQVNLRSDEVTQFSFIAICLFPEGLMLLGLVQWWRRRN